MRKSASWLAVLLVLPFVAGCGPKQLKVSGVVLLDGKPLPGGRLTFRPADPSANSVSAELNEQGQYEIVLLEGNTQVSVDNREFAPRPHATGGGVMPPGIPPEIRSKLMGGGGGGAAPRPAPAPNPVSSRYRAIPEKYYMVESSGLDFVVKRGGEKHDIELSSK